ncbi:MAG: hypothetical protein ACM3U2_06895 [Deltaproteobacteria bacterium]
MTRIQIGAAAGFCAMIGVIAGAAQQQRGAVPEEPVAVRYARASQELAKIELKKLEEQNKRVPRAIPAIIVERAKINVKVAEAQVEQAIGPSAAGTVNVHIRYAEERVRVAELEFEKSQEARRRNPDAISELEIERLGLVAETARLRLAMWRDPVYLPSLLDQMQWELDRVSEEIVELNKRLEKDEWGASVFRGSPAFLPPLRWPERD